MPFVCYEHLNSKQKFVRRFENEESKNIAQR